MAIVVRLVYPVVFFLSGLSTGVWLTAHSGCSQMPEKQGDARGSRAAAETQFEKHLEKVGSEFGKEAGEFARQFKNLTIRIKKNPIDAAASPDGRFVIRMFGSNETIASDLRYPDKEGSGGELVRQYSFSSGGRTYLCDFARTTDGSRIIEVQFHIIDQKGGELVYVDSHGDGRWDRFTDYSRSPPKTYVRDGFCWKEITKERTAAKAK